MGCDHFLFVAAHCLNRSEYVCSKIAKAKKKRMRCVLTCVLLCVAFYLGVPPVIPKMGSRYEGNVVLCALKCSICCSHSLNSSMALIKCFKAGRFGLVLCFLSFWIYKMAMVWVQCEKQCGRFCICPATWLMDSSTRVMEAMFLMFSS